MKDHISGITVSLAIVLIVAIIFGCSQKAVSLPAKKTPQQTSEASYAAPQSLQKWMSHFSWDGKWTCRKTTEEEPTGHYCTLQSAYSHSDFVTLFCNSESCDVVTLVHEAKWSRTLPNPGFSAPIFSGSE